MSLLLDYIYNKKGHLYENFIEKIKGTIFLFFAENITEIKYFYVMSISWIAQDSYCWLWLLHCFLSFNLQKMAHFLSFLILLTKEVFDLEIGFFLCKLSLSLEDRFFLSSSSSSSPSFSSSLTSIKTVLSSLLASFLLNLLFYYSFSSFLYDYSFEAF